MKPAHTSNEPLQRKREAFFGLFPKAGVLDDALHTEANPTPLFFVTSNVMSSDLRYAGFALGRLGSSIERQFSLNGEIAFFFVPWRDFQRRSFQIISSGFAEYARKLNCGKRARSDLHPRTK